MPIPDDDDGLLKRSLTPNDAVAAGPCLDAETLAAWADASTPISGSDDIERHLASCGRCQAMLAAFAHAEIAEATHASATVAQPAAARPSNVVPFKSGLPRWVPIVLGAMAASLVIYAVWPAHRPSDADRPDQTIASAAPASTTPLVPNSRAFADAAAPATKTPDVSADRKSPSATPTKPTGQTANAITAPSPAPEPLTARPMSAPPAVLGTATTSGVAIAPPPPPPAVAGASSATAAGASAAAATPTRSGELLMLRSATDATKTVSPTRVVAEFASPLTAPSSGLGQALVARGGGGGGGRGGGLAASTPRPTARVNWHVLASGQVERSVDSGQTWSPVTIAPAVTVVNGAAPSASVCWLIGRNGIVLLSTNGVTFRQVRSPDVADLRSIVAINELEATVTTNDGRIFTTDDGGDHWKQ